MAKRHQWTLNQKILFWTFLAVALGALAAWVALFVPQEKAASTISGDGAVVGDNATTVVDKSVAIEGDGAVIGDGATVVVDKRQGIDNEFLFSETVRLAEAKGGLEIELQQAREERAKAIKRVEELEAQGNRPDAEKALRELRETGDMAGLQELLVKERDKHRDSLIERNREIASVAYLRGDIDAAEEAYEEILRLDPNDLHAMNCKGMVQQLQGEPDEAASSFARVIEMATDQKNETWRAAATGNLAAVLATRGDLDGAMALHKEEERIWRQLGNLDGLQRTLGNQAVILTNRGDLDGAMALHKEKERICHQLGDLDSLSISLGNQAMILYARGDLDGAMDLLKEVEQAFRQLGNLVGLQASLGNQAVILEDRGDLDGAMALQKEDERICRRLGYLDGLQTSLGNQALVLEARGDLDGAMALHKEKERICRQLGNVQSLTISLANQASVLHEMGRTREALPLAEEARSLAAKHGYAVLVREIEPLLNDVRQAAEGTGGETERESSL